MPGADREYHIHYTDNKDAADVLGDIGDPAAVKGLVRALQGEEPSVRYAAARALGHIGYRAAIEGLTTALQDENHHVRAAAAWALARIRESGLREEVAPSEQ